jgi:plasmid stabilization system protein ParE
MKIVWTDKAIETLASLIDYVEMNWSDKSVSSLKSDISYNIEAISKFPNAFPVSTLFKDARKCVIRSNYSVLYRVSESSIIILLVIDNRMSSENLKLDK